MDKIDDVLGREVRKAMGNEMESGTGSSETGTGSETKYVLSAESHALLVKRIAELEQALAEYHMALNHIATEFMTTEEIQSDCDSMGLTYEEYLEMAYENMQGVAQAAIDAGALTEVKNEL